MGPWIEELEAYTAPDFALASKVPDLITLDTLYEILGKSEVYALKDDQRLDKRQMSLQEYRSRMDVPDGYSQDRMLQILRDRCRYLIERGATLNNPHIPGTYFAGWEKITTEPAKRLRELVAEALRDAAKKSRRALQKSTVLNYKRPEEPRNSQFVLLRRKRCRLFAKTMKIPAGLRNRQLPGGGGHCQGCISQLVLCQKQPHLAKSEVRSIFSTLKRC